MSDKSDVQSFFESIKEGESKEKDGFSFTRLNGGGG